MNPFSVISGILPESALKTITALLAVLALELVPCCLDCFAAGTDGGTGSAGVDSLLFAKQDEYLHAIDGLPIAQACAEVDFLISSVADSTLRNKVAARTWRHFRNSAYMGAENVAVHIFDRWFASFKAVFEDIDEFDEAEFFSMANRSSLVGREAPSIRCVDVCGDTLSLPAKRRPAIIFFYSTECAKCLLTARMLKRYLSANRLKANIYLVYPGDDTEAWEKYKVENLSIANNCRTKVYHLMPADGEFIFAYGVIQTPRLFYVNARGVIEGRNLDVPALEKIISASGKH